MVEVSVQTAIRFFQLPAMTVSPAASELQTAVACVLSGYKRVGKK
jgi:hypothetical protein